MYAKFSLSVAEVTSAETNDEEGDNVKSEDDFLTSLTEYALEAEFKDKDEAETLKKQQLTDLASRLFEENVSRVFNDSI